MNILIQRPALKLLGIIFLSSFLFACSNDNSAQDKKQMSDNEEAEVIKGPRGGRILSRGDFSLELAIFETGVPPEFRAWASFKEQQLSPTDFKLNITLTRLSVHESGKLDVIKFKPLGDALRGDMVIYEPHSFVVNIIASHNGVEHKWQYDNFEGRTEIKLAVAKALEIESEVAGPVVIHETVDVFGQIKANTASVRQLRARYAGVIKSVKASMGETVRKGQTLATIESNESLNLYSIKAPISGVITMRKANPGEQTDEQALFVITDTSTVWVDLAIFPADISRVKVGAQVHFKRTNSEQSYSGKITFVNVVAESNQSVTARMVVDNKDGVLVPGRFIKAKIKVAEHAVPLAVKRSGLQTFRDFTVIYAQIGDEYEVRMLELGRKNDVWIEVLSGLKVGTPYVSVNSYIIKADIEKSGATHDH